MKQTPKRHEEYRYIGQGVAGVYAEGIQGTDTTFSVSGCRERTIDEFVRNADRTIADGAWCIDKRDAIARHGARSVLRSPLPDIRGNGSPTPDISAGASIVADALATDPGNGYGSLVRGARAGAVCLDTVGMDAYVAYWRELGAKIGRVQSGVVVWEN